MYKTERIFLGGKYDSIHLSEMMRLFRNFTIEYCCLSLHSNIDFLVMWKHGKLARRILSFSHRKGL
jgi:hypothetical protein